MATLIYTAITSLDGYIEDPDGEFDWAAPDAEVHAFVNDVVRTVGTHLYGRRMYETMAVWQTIGGRARVAGRRGPSSPSGGGPSTRSCTHAHSTRSGRPAPDSSHGSTRRRSAP